MNNNRYRVSYAFASLPDNLLILFVTMVITCLKNNLAFPNLPMAITGLLVELNAFQEAVNALELNGDAQYVAARDEARETLLDSMRKTGAYVQSVALNNLSMLLSSGFEAVPQASGSSPLAAPTILAVTNHGTGTVLLRLSPVVNARSYQIQTSLDGGKTWQDSVVSPQARRVLVPKLLPGTVYSLQARAIGGSTGQSLWSTPVSIMAT